MPSTDHICIRGARTHNLQNIDVDIPRGKLVVITGVSGSGKSTLAFDTLLAEGHRQYVESLSVYSRQFFDQMERPDVDGIEGLEPTIAIDQQPATQNPRSTVGTVTEIYDYLRLLMARVGQVLCPACTIPIAQQTPAEIEQAIRGLPDESRVMLLAPMVRGRRGSHRDTIERIRKAGLVRVRIDGQIYMLEDVPPLVPQVVHDVEAIVDRLVIRENIDNRLSESLRLALRHGEGVLAISYQSPDFCQEASDNDQWDERIFNTRYACPQCKTSVTEIEPRTFSFNSPYGACPACDGTGFGDDEEFCRACHGARLRPEALACRLSGLAIHEIAALTIIEAATFFGEFEFDEDQQPVGEPIVAEILRRLQFLLKVGTDYLTLDRSADTLSGGEMQRVRLATGIGSGLVGILYLLDEPSIGLHPCDNGRLIAALRELQQEGNSIVVVEHDEAIMLAADEIIDIGPGAGAEGGHIVAQGSPSALAASGNSLTAEYLSGGRSIKIPAARRAPNHSRVLKIKGATANNLQNLSVKIPLELFVCCTGVSGSGKSTLIIETLGKALAREINRAENVPGAYRCLEGVNQIDRLVRVDQAPIGRTPRSNAATYTGVFDEIRKVFAGTRQAKQHGYKIGRFSFNVKGGRCEECKGQGLRKIEMKFLSDMFVTCEVCHGARFNRQTLAVRFREQSIADVLAMSIDQASEFFENHPSIHDMLNRLIDVGLGYLTLGQPSTTLSGGEAQRIKLATELGRPHHEHGLYIFDEPTTGLHKHDIARLLGVLQTLVGQGNSVVVIEHNLDVVRAADWVIDLGPEGGAGGGQIVTQGTPEEIARCAESQTGRFLLL